MSSKIVFNINEVNSSVSGLSHTISRLQSIENRVSGVGSSVDPRILGRNGISGQFRRASASSNRIEMHMKQLKSFTIQSADRYANSENRVNRQADAVNKAIEAARKQIDGRFASDLYETYNNTIGRLEDILHGLQYSAGAGIMHLLGFRFKRGKDLKHIFHVLDELKFGKFNIPMSKYISMIEGSRVNNFLAKMMIKPSSVIFKSGAKFSEVLYKRVANFYPDDLVSLTDSMADLRKSLAHSGTFRAGMDAVKSHAGTVLKSGWKLARGNALLAGVITAGSEAIGAGIKITENYSIYSGNTEKLKEENAKVVGRAVFKTGVVTATSLGGAVIGGAALSFLGPPGTMIGATLGGIAGSWVGDKIAGFTPLQNVVDKVSVNFKDSIYKGTEAIASGVSKVKDGFNSVKSHASNLLSSSKSFLGSLSFGN
ncbi:hypothetical protein [Mesobacillus jeotgali]|uniref:LXG domain-containing protein n=1 Tax=Mesobacillus jeotgali TaxID=129985 RepID=A0ABY9VR58_9BACI|nr:hypothetical protein [Mesobacillus jeotgali]WNF23461.1 hypothetical protein RH061_02815 [Mesobacillus jeotgali]